MTGAGWLTRLQRMLVILGVACLGYYGYATVGTASFQRRAIEEFRLPHELRPSGVSPASQTAAARPPTLERASAVQSDPDWARASFDWARASFQQIPFKTRGHDALAVLHIPRLGMVTPVVSGDDQEVLDVAVGHLPDTPLPWETGNSAVAAHRDGLFRPLKDIRVGDRLTMQTARGDFEYEVKDTKIVEPSDLSVLRPLDADALTLIIQV